MTPTRGDEEGDPAASGDRGYESWLVRRLRTPNTLPTLQLIDADQYYQTLDQQIIRCLDDKAEPHFLLQILDFRSCEERGVMCRIVKSKSKGRIGDGC